MDQLVPVIEFLKKNKFWLTSGIIALTSLVMWFLSTGSIDKQTKQQESTIKSSISSAQNIKKVTPEGSDDVNRHPNEETKKGMEKEIESAVSAVVQAWKLRFDAQKDVRTWPAEVIQNQDFLNFVDQFDPPESFPVNQTGSKFQSYLTVYKQQIPQQMANIAEKAKTFWMFDNVRKRVQKRGDGQSGDADRGSQSGDRPSIGGGRGSFGRDGQGGRGGSSGITAEGAETEAPKPVVVWNKTNQEYWNTKLTNFKGRDDHRLTTDDPSPMQVFMLQQDLWLLEAMFEIIGAVNGPEVIANDLATIKQIDHIAFGSEARAVLGSVQEPVKEQSGDGSGGGTNAPNLDNIERGRNRARMAAKYGAQTGGAGFQDDPNGSPFHGRYVDENFEPIPADVVRKVLTGKDLPEKYLELIVAKRVPVRLGVVMDETKISEFIAECAKSPFTFEIHQIRINKHTPGEGIELKGAQKKKSGQRGNDNLTIGGGGSAGMEGPDEGGGGGGNDGSGSVAVGDVDTRNSFDVKVEFYGIVKIYNKVDEARLTGKQPGPDATQP